MAAHVVRPIDAGLLAAAAVTASARIGADDEPVRAIDAAVEALYEAVAGAMPSVFVLEHGRLWLVAQRGYAVVPDGITIESGITGRAKTCRSLHSRQTHPPYHFPKSRLGSNSIEPRVREMPDVYRPFRVRFFEPLQCPFAVAQALVHNCDFFGWNVSLFREG